MFKILTIELTIYNYETIGGLVVICRHISFERSSQHDMEKEN